MKVESKDERRNDVLKRRELTYVISHPMSPTPSRKDFQKMVASELSVAPEQVEVRKLYSFSGQPKTRVRVYVWDEKKVKNLSEEKPAEASEEKKEGE